MATNLDEVLIEVDLKNLKTEVQSLDRHLSLVKKKLEILESSELSQKKNCSSCSSPSDHLISIQDHVIAVENKAENQTPQNVDRVTAGKKGKKKAIKEQQQQQHKIPFCHSLLLEKENLSMLSLESPSPVLSIVDGIQQGHNANNLKTMDNEKNIDADSNSSPPQLIAVKKGKSDNHLVSTAYCARLSSHLRRDSLIVAFLQGVVGFRQENGHLVVEKIAEDSPLVKKGLIHVGDSIMEVNGAPVATTDDLKSQISNQEVVTLKIVQSGLGASPIINGDFVKCCFDYEPENDQLIPNKKAGLKFKTGDVLQILNKDDSDWWQARKVNDWSFCGLIPSRTFEERRKASVTDQNNKEKKKATSGVVKKLLYNSKNSHDLDEHDLQIYRDVCKLSPYGRRVLVLIGASGVGRRTLKARLLQHDRENFATVTPYTSRKPRDGETEGREYHFETKDQMKKEIDQQKFLEYGEYNGNIYGTKLESVKAIIKNGKVCVLDCSVQAIRQLYNSDFMPYIVFVAPPPLEEFKQIYLIHPNRTKQKTNEDLERICEESSVLDQQHRHLFDLTLINRNVEVTFRRLYDALESLKNHSQWIPSDWLYG